MKAMIGFTKGLMSMPMPWPLWIGLLLVINIAGPLYFFETFEAKVVLAAFLASAASMTAIFRGQGVRSFSDRATSFGSRWFPGCGPGSIRSSPVT